MHKMIPNNHTVKVNNALYNDGAVKLYHVLHCNRERTRTCLSHFKFIQNNRSINPISHTTWNII